MVFVLPCLNAKFNEVLFAQNKMFGSISSLFIVLMIFYIRVVLCVLSLNLIGPIKPKCEECSSIVTVQSQTSLISGTIMQTKNFMNHLVKHSQPALTRTGVDAHNLTPNTGKSQK